MGRVPLWSVLLVSGMLAGCEPDPAPESVDVPKETPEENLRDAGVAAREALEKAGDALKKLGEAATGKAQEVMPDTPASEAPEAPVEERQLVPIDPADDAPESEIRDSGAATAEAAARILDATRKAAAKVKEAGKDVVEAIREEPQPPESAK
ncbi:hypothetical protein [Denitromonas iodatirespirans]|uniref:Uncharacterized protein n=1 Tax=Denitromonas iodatirespirans TaxID=2795389 RepID=A0A944D4Z5_DENI1|nr:hypothetical protein [Denitromonas iodatirespirans]MBT0959945.1 hypothetical protein [Denitromonas iodatirespirans]